MSISKKEESGQWSHKTTINFRKNGNFNYFMKNIFMNDHVGKKRWHGNAFAKFNFATEQNS